MKLSNAKRTVLTAVCTALCVILPMAFHTIPNGGAVVLPMHIPVLLCGLICSWPYGLICGLLGPALSSLLTGMPLAAVLPGMTVECAVYGCSAGAMMALIRTKNTYLDLYICLTAAMVLGRVVSGFAKAWIFAPGTPIFAWVTTSLVTGIPGIVLQLALIPTLVYALMRARLLPLRYPRESCEPDGQPAPAGK